MPVMKNSEFSDTAIGNENLTEDLRIETNEWAPSPDLPSWVSFIKFGT